MKDRRAAWVNLVTTFTMLGASILLLWFVPTRSVGATTINLVAIGRSPVEPAGSDLGPVTATTRIAFDVALQPSHQAELASSVDAVSMPGSPAFHHYLSRGQFAQRFGASNSAIEKVEGWLRSAGITSVRIAPSHVVLEAIASAGAVERATHSSIDRYKTASGFFTANVQAPLVPSSIADDVSAVIGLDNRALQQPAGIARLSGAGLKGAPDASSQVGPSPSPTCSQQIQSAGGGATAGYTADQIAQAYSMSNLYAQGDTGAGTTTALVEFAGYSVPDILTYEQCYGVQTVVTPELVDGGPVTFDSSSEIESELDIEEIIGLAPNTHILVYEGPNSSRGVSDQASFDTLAQIVNDDLAQVVSTSWGQCEPNSVAQDVTAENTLFEQAALQGQTILAAAGDSGSEGCFQTGSRGVAASLAVDDPASQPFVTGVGGTTLTVSPRAETVWHTSPTTPNGGAGGGGISSNWPMPQYQSSAPSSLGVVSSFSSGTPCGVSSGNCREVPDVSSNAGSPFAIYCTINGCNNGWTGFGGTSAAAPTWAALITLANASSACATTKPIGWLNPLLYGIASSSAYTQSFNDVTVGQNDFTGSNGGDYPAAVGYDMASGLGTPIAMNATGGGLVDAMCAPPSAIVNTSFLVPKIKKVKPARAHSTGGAHIVLTGSEFTGASRVKFGSHDATFVVTSPTRIVVIVPPGHGTVHINVMTRGGMSAPTRSNRFTYITRPIIGTVTPRAGTGIGGTTVTITGSYLQGARAVYFGNLPAPRIISISPTRLVVLAPAGAGLVDVQVTGPGGTSLLSPRDRYRYTD